MTIEEPEVRISTETADCFKPTKDEEREEFNIERDDDEQEDDNSNINCLYEKLEKDYDKEVENIIEKSNEIISNTRYGAGLYQFFLIFLATFMWAIGYAWALYVDIFAGYTPPHKCLVNDTEAINIDKCTYLNVTTNQTVTCNKWIYDKSQMENTMITEYDLVCEKDYHFEFMYTIETSGDLFGIAVFSFFANHYGKRPIYFLSSTIAVALGLIQYWLKSIYVYMAIGFFINFISSGLDVVCFSLVLEAFQSRYRTRYSMISIYIFAIAIPGLAPMAYIINTWRELRLAVFIITAALTLSSYFIVHESVTWLISIGRLDDAERVIKKIARINQIGKNNEAFKGKLTKVKRMFEQLSKYNENVLKNKMDKKEDTNKYMEIIRNKKFLLYLLVSMFSWSMVLLVYEGLTYLNASVGENIFLNWFFMTIIELASQFVCHYFIEKYGRKLVITVSLILTGLTLIFAGLSYLDIIKISTIFKTCVFVCAKFLTSISITTVMIHTAEIFPTNIRSFCYGLCLFASHTLSSVVPILSIYLAKAFPFLPVAIYAIASIAAAFLHLYLPETVNRPLPNSIQDIISREKG